MWYIFPQVGGLGVSAMSLRYAIGSVAEAQALLTHPVLGDRYRRIVDAAWHKIVEDGATVNALFGSPDDAKLVSSLTRPIAPLWVKKTVKNGPLRSIRSQRSISPTGC